MPNYWANVQREEAVHLSTPLVAHTAATSPSRTNESFIKNENIPPSRLYLCDGYTFLGDNHCPCANNRKTDRAGASRLGKEARRDRKKKRRATAERIGDRACPASAAKPAERPLTQYEFVRLEREKAEHIKRAVRMAKRGFERIEKRWDEREAADSKAENLTAATLDRHDTIIRRNLGMNESPERPCAVNLSVLSGGRAVVQVNQKKEQQ